MTHQLIVITGHSGSGKTTLARQLAARYRVLLVSKDDLKERMFDGLGSNDKEWSLKVSGVAHRIMDDIVKQELANGRSVIVESNFKKDIDSQRFNDIAKSSGAQCVQILCKADGDVLFGRWNERIANGTRHQGHVESVSLEDIRLDMLNPYPPLDLPGQLIEIDTTDPATISLPDLPL